MKILLITIFSLTTTMIFAQQQTKSGITNKDEGQVLDSIFPIDNIIGIKVTNNSGRHNLTTKELTVLKGQLKLSKFAGGLLIKPGHIILDIKLKDTTIAKSGFVYASTGEIHFDGGTDKYKQRFSGTFYLPTKLNFDNYK
jgi:hypothetical protein